jgi:hypothetical protein
MRPWTQGNSCVPSLALTSSPTKPNLTHQNKTTQPNPNTGGAGHPSRALRRLARAPLGAPPQGQQAAGHLHHRHRHRRPPRGGQQVSWLIGCCIVRPSLSFFLSSAHTRNGAVICFVLSIFGSAKPVASYRHYPSNTHTAAPTPPPPRAPRRRRPPPPLPPTRGTPRTTTTRRMMMRRRRRMRMWKRRRRGCCS